MTDAVKAQLRAVGIVVPAAKGNTPAPGPAPRTANDTAKETAARQAVVGVARLAWTNTTFGFPLPCRKFLLQSEEQAQALDALFYELTTPRS